MGARKAGIGIAAAAAALAVLLSVAGAGAQNRAAMVEDGKAAYEAKDFDKAIRILVPLAQDGSAEAQYYLGLSFEFGHGTAQNLLAALSWYEMAAEQNHADAQFRIGYLNLMGEGIPVNLLKAYVWFQIALRRHRYWENRANVVYFRDVARTKLTPRQIEVGDELALSWQPGGGR
jgi:TPR repeat protein